jgi:hypothetical protein
VLPHYSFNAARQAASGRSEFVMRVDTNFVFQAVVAFSHCDKPRCQFRIERVCCWLTWHNLAHEAQCRPATVLSAQHVQWVALCERTRT